MDQSVNITRRRFLHGVPVAAAAVAIPVGFVGGAALASVQSDLRQRAEAFADAFIAHAKADRLAKQAGRDFDDALRKARLRVQTSMTVPAYLEIGPFDSPGYIRDQLKATFAKRLNSARDRALQKHPLRSALPTEADVMREQAELMRRAERVFRKYRRLRAQSGVVAAQLVECDAYEAMRNAREALNVIEPKSLDEAQIIARAMVRAGKETERWYDLPWHAFILGLAGESDPEAW